MLLISCVRVSLEIGLNELLWFALQMLVTYENRPLINGMRSFNEADTLCEGHERLRILREGVDLGGDFGGRERSSHGDSCESKGGECAEGNHFDDCGEG